MCIALINLKFWNYPLYIQSLVFLYSVYCVTSDRQFIRLRVLTPPLDQRN